MMEYADLPVGTLLVKGLEWYFIRSSVNKGITLRISKKKCWNWDWKGCTKLWIPGEKKITTPNPELIHYLQEAINHPEGGDHAKKFLQLLNQPIPTCTCGETC